MEGPIIDDALTAPVQDLAEQAMLVDAADAVARRFARVSLTGPLALRQPDNGIFSLAQWQSGFRLQNDRGTCWAFAGRPRWKLRTGGGSTC